MDWNNDGKKDLLTGEYYGTIRVYINSGTDSAPVFTTFSTVKVGSSDYDHYHYSKPFVVDWNNDGKKDLICAGYNGDVELLINTGSDASPSFSAKTNIKNGVSNLDVGLYSYVVCGDWDRDGKKDLIVGDETGALKLFRNKGTDAAPLFSGHDVIKDKDGNIVKGAEYSALLIMDWNRDGYDDLVVSESSGQTFRYTAMDPTQPIFSLASCYVDDFGWDSSDDLVRMTLSITNSGARATNVTAVLSCDSAQIDLVRSEVEFGTVEGASTCLQTGLPACCRVTGGGRIGAGYRFTTDIYYNDGATQQVQFAVGGYDYHDVSYSWIDISDGTIVSLGDMAMSGSTPIGFSFPYYGGLYSAAYIADDGYITFQSASQSQYINTSIPVATSPNSIIGGFWDDLNTGTGTVRHKQVVIGEDDAWVVEWSEVQHYNDTNSIITCQIILHEDGRIKFQYKSLEGTLSDGSGATIGIENHDGDGGVQVSYNTVGAISNGDAIEFYIPSVFSNEDGDNLPDEYESIFFGGSSQVGSGDYDHDGVSNREEFELGTNPADATSRLWVNGVSNSAPNKVVVKWESVPGKGYQIYSSSDIINGPWVNITPSEISSTAASCCYTVTVNEAESTFFKVIVP